MGALDRMSRPPSLYMLASHHICMFIDKVKRLRMRFGPYYAFFGLQEFTRSTLIGRMMEAVRARGPVVLVGPPFLGRLHKVFAHQVHIWVPNPRFCKGISGHHDAWHEHTRIEAEMLNASARFGERVGVTFLMAGGMAAKVITVRMMFKLPKDTFIDIGSAFDGWAGHKDRDYNHEKAFVQVGRDLGWFNETGRRELGC